MLTVDECWQSTSGELEAAEGVSLGHWLQSSLQMCAKGGENVHMSHLLRTFLQNPVFFHATGVY